MQYLDNPIRMSKKFRPLFQAKGSETGEPLIKTRYVLVSGGRGSGKSWAVSTALCTFACFAGWKILFSRWTMASARDSIIPEFLEKIEVLKSGREFKSGVQDIEHTPTKSQILFRGIKTSQGTQTAKLKSLQGINCWVLDEAEEMPDEKTFDVIDLSVRDPRHPNIIVLVFNPTHKTHWIYRRFWEPYGVPDSGYCGVVEAANATYISSDYRDNKVFAKSNPEYIALAEKCKAVNWRKYENIWLGAWVSEIEGALWSYEMIHAYRREPENVPELKRVVVAIDPSATDNLTSDEAGIVVAGEGVDDHYYVLSDRSGVYPPRKWAENAIQEYRKHKASRIVAESNHGGLMVEETIRAVDRNVRVRLISASRGKIPRAEPIAALYELGRVHHVGTFRDMESEMMSYTGFDPNYSPGRLDALVWSLAELSGIDPNSWSPEDVLEKAVKEEW